MIKSFLHIGIGIILISPLQSIKTEEVPPDLVYPSPGCGTGCSITQISKTYPEKLDNGWIRVKVEKTKSFHKSSPFFYDDEKGEEGSSAVCQKSLVSHCLNYNYLRRGAAR